MAKQKIVEEILNNFYVKAWAIVEDLSLVDIAHDDPIRKSIDDFVSAVRGSFATIKQGNYANAWKDLQRASAGFIGLCRYKDQHLPNVDQDLPIECAEAYRALPDPEQAPITFNPSKIHEINVKRMVEAYQGNSRHIKPRTVLDRLSL